MRSDMFQGIHRAGAARNLPRTEELKAKVENGRQFESLFQHPAWQAVEAKIKARIDTVLGKLVGDTFEEGAIRELRAEARVMKNMLAELHSVVQRGKDASRDLEKMEDQAGSVSARRHDEGMRGIYEQRS